MSPKMATAVLMAMLAPRGTNGDALPTPRLDGLPCSVGCEDCAGNGKGQCSQSECGGDAVEFGAFHCTPPWNGATTPVRCCLPKECTSDGDCEEGKICSEEYRCREPSCQASGGTCRAPDMAQVGPGGNTPPACLPGERVKYYERSTCDSECGYFWGQCGETCCLPAAEGAGAEDGNTTTEGAAAGKGSSRDAPALPTPGHLMPGQLPPNVPPGLFPPYVPSGVFTSPSSVTAASLPATVSKAALWGPRSGSLGEKKTSPVTAWVSSEVACLALVALLALLLLGRVKRPECRAETSVEQDELGLLQRTSE